MFLGTTEWNLENHCPHTGRAPAFTLAKLNVLGDLYTFALNIAFGSAIIFKMFF